MAKYLPEESQSMEITRPPTVTSSRSSSGLVKMYLLRSMRGIATLGSLTEADFLLSKMYSFNGMEKTIAGSSVEANRRVKFGPKQAAATRPFGTFHLSGTQGDPVPMSQTLFSNQF